MAARASFGAYAISEVPPRVGVVPSPLASWLGSRGVPLAVLGLARVVTCGPCFSPSLLPVVLSSVFRAFPFGLPWRAFHSCSIPCSSGWFTGGSRCCVFVAPSIKLHKIRQLRSRVFVRPRVGGEHMRLRFLRLSGSSPRGRGTHSESDCAPEIDRFIPARAGNTRPDRPRSRRPTVHPRAGGEHSVVVHIRCSLCGSSPRGRGTHEAPLHQHGAFRFIPARAGNTAETPASGLPPSVHPRAGGEHVGHLGELDRLARFIPARAGNTVVTSSASRLASVHPRAGGEHSPSGESSR